MKLSPLSLIALFGCTASDPTIGVETADLTKACIGTATRIDHSLAITDPAVLAKFSFQRTVQALIASVPGSTETPTHLFQTWMSAYADCTNPRIDPQHFGIVCPRTEELLATFDPFDPASHVTFVPSGIFNRFDLAPSDGANCGEYRISYEMPPTGGALPGLAFLIFEGVLPNPHPEQGIEGCRAVAQWWKARSTDASSTVLASNLENFFYNGTAIPGVQRVVDAKHYGFGQNHSQYGAGQIRANMFVGLAQWNLREFKTNVQSDLQHAFSIDQVTVKDNPANELFSGSAATGTDIMHDLMREEVVALGQPDLNNINMEFPDWSNEYESVSSTGFPGQAGDVLYDRFSNSAMRTAIQTGLTEQHITDLSVDQILRRASTQTCAGCHQLSTVSPENSLGRNGVWPITNPFTHIQSGRMSSALTTVFLPHRVQVLENFLCTPVGAVPVDSGKTLGGSHVGAPN